MRSFLTVILVFSAFWVLGQKLTVSGKVVDKDTGEPLPFASIVIKGRPVGTVANLQGEFDFHFSADYRNDILVVSMIGYENYETPVWSVLNTGLLTITLNKSVTLLHEVVVTDSLTGGEIFRIALSRIEQNFPMQPFLLSGFYRDVKKVGGTSISLLEAAVKIYDENYAAPRNKNKLRERVKLVEVRKSLGYDNRFATYFDQKNLLEDLLLHNNIRYRQIDTTNNFLSQIVREKDTYYNGHDIFVITHSGPFSLKVYVDQEDYSIVHLEYEIETHGENLARNRDLVSKLIRYKKTIDFRRYLGKMFLNYITVTTNEQWYEMASGRLQFETELLQNLLVNEVLSNPLERIGPTEKMRNYGLQYQDYPYNKAFWDGYNVLKETPLDKQVLTDLEKLAPLDKQFEDN